MKRFQLHCYGEHADDAHGGPGRTLGEGIVFSDGTTVLRDFGHGPAAIIVWASMDAAGAAMAHANVAPIFLDHPPADV